MPVVTRKRTSNFAIIPNAVAEDNSLSFAARGLLCYLLAKPHDWRVEVGNIQKAGSIGRDKSYSLLNELKTAGYVKYEAIREQGSARIIHHSYTVYDCAVPARLPFPENPEVDKAAAEKTAETGLLPENPDLGEPLPEKATSGKSGKNNKKEGIPKKNPPYPPEDDEDENAKRLFSEIKAQMKPAQLPKKLDEALRQFSALEDEDQRLAHQFFPFYLKECLSRRRPPQLFTYLKKQLWLPLAAPPQKDAEGYFVIEWHRPEWDAWLSHITETKGPEAASKTRSTGIALCKRRWPSDPKPEEADRHD